MKMNMPETERSGIDWSPQQRAVFNHVATSDRSLQVEAVAGSGKTTTIVEAMHHIPKGKTAIFVAFNRSIADELATKVPPGIEAKTLHAIGWSMLRDNKYKMWKTKNKIILQDLIASDPSLDENYLWDILQPTNRVIGMLKANHIISTITTKDVEDTSTDLGLDLEWSDCQIIKTVWELGETHSKYEGKADFDDMLRTPVQKGMDFPTYDIVFVDEAQDLNLIQHLFVERMVKEGGRVISVGDRHQAIYAFRGASKGSMDQLAERFNSVELPLSVSYRCDISIVREAQKFNKAIEHRDSAGIGHTGSIYAADMYCSTFDPSERVMIVGRYNSSCFRTALRMRLKGKPVYLMGRDIVPTLVRMAKNVRKEMGFFNARSITGYLKLKKGTRGYGAVLDNCNILYLCIEEGVEDETKLGKYLYEMFPEHKPSFSHITICTVHKSKGLEADVVYILDSEMMPTCLDDVEVGSQEGNIVYVAITRAKKELYYVI